MPDDKYRRDLLRELHTLNQNISRVAKAQEDANRLALMRIRREEKNEHTSPDFATGEENGIDQTHS